MFLEDENVPLVLGGLKLQRNLVRLLAFWTSLFNDDLSNAPTFSQIHLTRHYL
jgi:hypothetical protein